MPWFMQHSPGFVKLVEQALARVPEIAIEELSAFLAKGGVLIDVREESEWAQGHIPQALFLSKGIIERDIEQQVPELGASIALICGGGYRSALAADNLLKMGYQQVFSVAGGMRRYRSLNLPEQK